MEKPCCRCKLIKNITEFTKEVCKKDGLCAVCKECKKKARKKYNQKNREIIRLKQREKRKKFQKWAGQFKGKCGRCGETHPACLDFHHIKEKEASIASMINRGSLTNKLKEKIIEEIKKCEVLCSNCHRKVHWEERQNRLLSNYE
jgi:hypothetical protein